ncbi:MAG: hypothetical protein J6K88_02135 [Oscillospiraceae bacterium]|nr:hypothetical protein [Oscillospiraceae bacterium]
MKYIMSMVHHNPGEAPFESIFNDAENLSAYGYNAQVFKHINTVITFDKLGLDLFPKGSEDRKWLDSFTQSLVGEMKQAKAAGKEVYYHIDLFVLPKKLVEAYKGEILDENGKISLEKEMTLELHRVLIDEVFSRFPEIDGFIIRVGETYLHDTPYHIGNGAVIYGDKEKEKAQFIRLIEFLKEEVSIKWGKKLFFRTWDCFPDRFHADLNYYLDITDKIEPHENLYFSIKYVALDFWRRVKWNECLCKGKHKQIIEVQCQREYEGKGAYPMYVMSDVINGDKYLKKVVGLKDVIDNPLIDGIYAWPRGGGWLGPRIKNEFWCRLNTYVLGKYAENPSRTEEEIFSEFCREDLKLSKKDTELFREMCLTANEAILRSRYIEEYDKTLNESFMPSGNWMRDECLGGMDQLGEAFEVLYENNSIDAAVKEKEYGLSLWKKVKEISEKIDFSNSLDGEFIKITAEYAVKLFTITVIGWKLMAEGFIYTKTGKADKKLFEELLMEFDRAVEEYRKLSENPICPSLYGLEFLFDQKGMLTTINNYKNDIL